MAMQVVLGNETTENSLVHDVKVLKSDVEMDKEQDRQLVSRMDSVKTASDQLKEEVETVRKMKGPKGEQGDRGPKGESGSVGPQGERGLRGEQGPSDPFHLLPYIAQNAYYYVYVYPSRFQSIERTSKDNYRTRNLLDFTGKTISTEKLMMTKDNQQRCYLTLGKNRDMLIRDEMDNFFEDNKAFAIFQVCEANDPIVTNLSFTPVYIRFGYDFTGFGGDALYFHIANITSVRMVRWCIRLTRLTLVCEVIRYRLVQVRQNQKKITSVLGKHVAPPFSPNHVVFDNATAAPKLTLALGKSVSHIQQIAGQKYVLSLSRNSEGVFAIHLNSVLVFSHTDNRPFHRINGDQKPEYRFGGIHFAQDTTLKFYCQLHFAKDLSEDIIKRIHAELMTHYNV